MIYLWGSPGAPEPKEPFMSETLYRGYTVRHSEDSAEWEIVFNGEVVDSGRTLNRNPYAIIDEWMEAR